MAKKKTTTVESVGPMVIQAAGPANQATRAVPVKSQGTYPIVLRTRKTQITVVVQDRVLYPRAVAWNRLLTADQGRQSTEPSDRLTWQKKGYEAIVDLAKAGGVAEMDIHRFLESAADGGEVQVEMDWEAENVGWAARVFPWESLIALATKPLREKMGVGCQRIVVVRFLRARLPARPAATGPIGIAVSAEAKLANCDTDTERVAIEAAFAPKKILEFPATTLEQLGDSLRSKKPRVLHYVLTSASIADAKSDGKNESPKAPSAGFPLEDVARTVATHHPQLIAFSAAQTGRRLAPLAIVHGARLAVGFHDVVRDSSSPVFFGAFYREWAKTGDVLEALRQGLDAHNWKKAPTELGGVSIWSATDLLSARRASSGPLETGADVSVAGPSGPPAEIFAALKVTCVLEKALNYSMLHNQRGGLFAIFDVLKLKPGKMSDLEISVKIDTGLERPVECHFFAALPEAAYRTVDFTNHVTVPLGSELLRRRGEMLRGTVEVLVTCDGRRVFHTFESIELPPCDEWNDDEVGRRFLPSFIFPRDPAVREILTHAQPFLRALQDDVRAAFDGYQNVPGLPAAATGAAGTGTASVDPLQAQLRSIWGALQHECRLDYANPPPSYTRNVQRVRTPEEILRSRRATCLELALLLASCWEHIGIYPVIFLSQGHAFTGYWASAEAWGAFFDTKKRIDDTKDIDPAAEGVKDKTLDSIDPAKASGGGMATQDAGWLLRATHHLALISREVKAGNLVAVEATSVARMEAFRDAIHRGREQLASAFAAGTFDGMIDVHTARDQRVTPLAIITQGVVA